MMIKAASGIVFFVSLFSLLLVRDNCKCSAGDNAMVSKTTQKEKADTYVGTATKMSENIEGFSFRRTTSFANVRLCELQCGLFCCTD
jgi:hypothetical protein